MSHSRRVVPLMKITEVDENSPHMDHPGSTKNISPMSTMIRDFNKSTISQRKKSNHDYSNLHPDSANVQSTNVGQEQNLFKNVFRIKNTPESAINPKAKSRRLLGMASRRYSSPETVSPSINKENGSPSCNLHSSPQKITGSKRSRCPLEDCDSNSQDSGYGASYHERDSRDGFQFAEPLGVAPRRMSVESRSPMQSPVRSSPHRQRSMRPSIFRSLSSDYESTDDGFNDLIDIDALDDATLLPNGITSLLSGSIVGSDMMMECDITTTPEFARTKPTRPLRRSMSLQNDSTEKQYPKTPQNSLSKVRSCLFRSPTAACSTAELTFDDDTRNSIYSIVDSPPVRSFKRPGPPSEVSPKIFKRARKSTSFQNIPDEVDSVISLRPPILPIVADIGLKLVKKSRKSNSFQDIPEEVESCCPVLPVKPILQRSYSETEAHAIIKSAIHRSTTDADLTGDFSKPCILPLAEGRHEDLKSISTETLAALMRGDFKDHIDNFTIVDCRYPYEYDGGHIEGALNLYSKDLIEEHLLNPLTNAPEIQPDSSKRSILVFHCEFSWERGPNLSRFLRNIDRQRNKEHYPALHYPEVYLLHGGYEQFYKEQRTLCSPQGYRPMRDPNHEADLRQFRSKSKSWQGDKPLGDKPRVNLTSRTNLKRLGF